MLGAAPAPALPCCQPALTFTSMLAPARAPQVFVGFAIPATLQAVWEARAFARHQQERRHLGLPAEGGWEARLYAFINEACVGLDAFVLLVAVSMALLVSWCFALAVAGAL